jgi:hypothetical protein
VCYSDLRAPLDFADIQRLVEIHKHVTLQLLLDEYRQCQPEGYLYSRFCELYRRWQRKQDVVLRQDHRAGEKMFVDWAGDTIPIYDRGGAEPQPASLFVAALGASSYTFARATASQNLANWIECHIQAFEFFQGTTKLIVPDNPRTGVTRACRYEPDLNRTYLELAQHYAVAIMPARPYKARDKACVSYCTSFLLCDGESWLLPAAASMAFHDRTFVQRFVETALGIVVAMLFQASFSCPKIDCRGRYTVAHTHLFGSKQAPGSQAAVTRAQAERLPYMRNFL